MPNVDQSWKPSRIELIMMKGFRVFLWTPGIFSCSWGRCLKTDEILPPDDSSGFSCQDNTIEMCVGGLQHSFYFSPEADSEYVQADDLMYFSKLAMREFLKSRKKNRCTCFYDKYEEKFVILFLLFTGSEYVNAYTFTGNTFEEAARESVRRYTSDRDMRRMCGDL